MMLVINAEVQMAFCPRLPFDDQTIIQVSCRNMLEDWGQSLILIVSRFYNQWVKARANSTIKRRAKPDHLKRSGLKQQHNRKSEFTEDCMILDNAAPTESL